MRILFDTETTGLLKPSASDSNMQPYITEICCVKIDDNFNLIDEIETYVKPPIPIPQEVSKITGIDDNTVRSAPTFEEIVPLLADFFVGTDHLIGHNLPFDRSMLVNELSRLDKQYMFPWPPYQWCTVEMSMNIEQRRLSLSKLHEYATGKPHEGAHRAKNDVYALVRCYHWLLERVSSGNLPGKAA
jgi:DNA polymerase III epsilon subunit-like protein